LEARAFGFEAVEVGVGEALLEEVVVGCMAEELFVDSYLNFEVAVVWASLIIFLRMRWKGKPM
jgi:hypothetical protein